MSGSVTQIRCSSLDDLFKCVPSVMGGDGLIRISPTNDAAELGNLIHDLAQRWVDEGDYDLQTECNSRGFTDKQRDDAAKLMGYVTRSWDDLKQYFPRPVCEQRVESAIFKADDGKQYQIVGTTDINSPIGTDNAIFLDWKSGYLDNGYHQQLFGYAYSIWCSLGRPPNTTITGVAVFLRHRYIRVTKYDATKLSQWEYDLAHNVIPASHTFKPGKQCTTCDMYATCPARRAVVSNMIDTLMPKPVGSKRSEYDEFLEESRELLSGLTEDNKGSPAVGQTIEILSSRIRMAQQQIDDSKSLIRGAVARVGAVKMPGGYELTLRDVEVSKVKPIKAMKILRNKLSDTEICQAMRLSLPTLMGTYSKRFKTKERGPAREQLFKELKDADAIEVDVQQRLEEIDTTKADMVSKESKNGKPRSNDTDGVNGDEGTGERVGAGGGGG